MSERGIWLLQRIHLAGQVESGSNSEAFAERELPQPADAEASEKGALITSEVCLQRAGGGSADEKHILGQDQSNSKIDYVR